MIKNKNVTFGLYVVVFVAFWNLLDFLWCVLISKTAYQFRTVSDLMLPLVLAIVSGYLFFLRDSK